MKKNLISFKWTIKIFVLLFVTTVGFLHQKLGGGFDGAPTVHALCPFGTLQDIFSSLGEKIFKRRFYVNKTLDSYLKYVKYIVLVVLLYFTWKVGKLIISPYDSFAAYNHISAGLSEVLSEYLWGFIFLIAILLSSLFYDNLFCIYICPLGAFYSVLGKFSVFKIKRDSSTCMKCIETCPTKKNSISIEVGSRSITPLKNSIFAISVFVAVILFSKSIGVMKTMPTTMSEIVEKDPNKIRGWMSIEQIITEFEIDKIAF